MAGEAKNLKTIGQTTMKITNYLSADEFIEFQQRSNAKATWILLANWAVIVVTFTLIARYPNPASILLGAFILAGRIHGLGVIMHECGHNIFFRQRILNQILGQWLAAGPAFDHLNTYATQHRKHHQLAGTPDDPDLGNYKAYPVSKSSFRRKVIRDLTGQTGLKLMAYKLSGLAGLLSPNVETRRAALPFVQLWLSQVMMLAALHFTLGAWLYLVWLGGMMTFHMLAVRLRQVAEHANVPNLMSKDPRDNTRTTYTNVFTRLWIGPNYVNYHLEHHIAAGVPAYNLPRLHRLLKARGAYAHTKIFDGYGDVLHQAVTE
jgi:fatty acid desaturase